MKPGKPEYLATYLSNVPSQGRGGQGREYEFGMVPSEGPLSPRSALMKPGKPGYLADAGPGQDCDQGRLAHGHGPRRARTWAGRGRHSYPDRFLAGREGQELALTYLLTLEWPCVRTGPFGRPEIKRGCPPSYWYWWSWSW